MTATPRPPTTVTLTYVEEGALKTVTGESGDPRLLAPRHSAHHRRAARGAGRGPQRPDQDAAGLRQRADPQLRGLRQARDRRLLAVPAASGRASAIDDPVSMGDYQCAQSPADPILLHVWSIPGTGDGSSARDQATAGRYLPHHDDLRGHGARHPRPAAARPRAPAVSTPPATSRRSPSTAGATATRSNTCGPGTRYWPDGPLPIETARKGWGRIAIANADSGAYAYAHSAIDQAGRAVNELIGGIEGFSTFPGPPVEVVN